MGRSKSLLPEQAFLGQRESLFSQQAFVSSAVTCIGTTQQSTYQLGKNCQEFGPPLDFDFDFEFDYDSVADADADADDDADCASSSPAEQRLPQNLNEV